MSRRVVVTGVGLISSVGIGTEANWTALCAGQSGIGPITHFDASQFAARIAGEVKGFDPLQFIDKKDVKKVDVFIQFAVAASQFAVDDARLEVTPENADQIGVFIASGIGGFSTIEREHKELLNGGPRRISPFFIPASIINLAAGQVSIRFGARGPEPGDVHGVHGLGAFDRRVVRDHPPRRRRRDDRRRIRGVDHADGRRRVRVDARAVDAQRRTRRAPAGRSTRTATASSSAKAPASSSSRNSSSRKRARRHDLRRDRRLRPVGRRVSPDRAARGRATAPCGRCAWRCARPASRPTRSTTSTRTARRRRSTTRPRRWPSRRRFGEHAHKLVMSSTKSMTGHLLGAAGGLEAGITRAGGPPPGRAADDQPRRSRSGLRPRLRAEREARR